MRFTPRTTGNRRRNGRWLANSSFGMIVPFRRRFAYVSPLALSSERLASSLPSLPPLRGQCCALKARVPHPRPLRRVVILSCTYTIGTASTRDTAYLVHFCWLTVSPSGVSESTSRRGRASARARKRARARARDPHASLDSDRVQENRSRRVCTHTRVRGVPKPQNILLRPPLPAQISSLTRERERERETLDMSFKL